MRFLLLLLLVISATADARRPTPCKEGRFLVSGGAALVGTLPSAGFDVVTLSGRAVTIESGCAQRRAKVTGTAKGTAISAGWGGCGARRKVKLRVLIDPTCTTMTGRISGKRFPAVAFTAATSSCGDGMVDPLRGEECDGAAGCSGGTCGGDCLCPVDQATTSTIPTTATTSTSTAIGPTTSTTLPQGGCAEPTAASLGAARAALAAGADEVALSPSGTCYSYRRTRTGSVVTREEVRRAGVNVLVWTHAGATSAMAADAAGDGVVERRIAVSRGTPPDGTVIITDDPEDDGSPTRRETWTRTGAQVAVTIEVANPSGTLEQIEAFTTTAVQEQAAPPQTQAQGTCSADEYQTLNDLRDEAIDTGLTCLRDNGLGSEADALSARIGTAGVEITCETGGGNRCAEIDFTDAILPGALAGKIGVTVYSDNFFNNAFCQGNQLNGMFHELLHSVYGPHKPGFNRNNDRTYACAALCFNKTTPPPVTRCQCAKCLGVDPCDPRCKGYATAADCDETCEPAISIDNLACPTTACKCGPLNGILHKGEVEGTASGPVGTLLRLNLPSFLGGQLSCPGWVPTPCPPPLNDLQCCERTDGSQASSIMFSGSYQPFLGICVCGGSPSQQNIVAQANAPSSAAEDIKVLLCP